MSSMPPPPPQAPQDPHLAAPAPRTNGLATASLVLSLVGLVPCFWPIQIPALLGVIFGFVARNQIRQSGGAQGGAGRAKAGIIIGGILLLLTATIWIALAASGGCFEIGTSGTC
ncbi:MAG: DUF4190 domain-containing protein [Ilumatobacteraceae bacterium]